MAFLIAFIVSISVSPNLIALFVVFILLSVFSLAACLTLICLYNQRKTKKQQAISNINNFKIDLIKGLDLIHLIYKLPRFQMAEKPKVEISQFNAKPSENQSNRARVVEPQVPIFNMKQGQEFGEEDYTVVKSNYFRFMDSVHQGKSFGATQNESRKPLQDITPSQAIMPRHLTFSEVDSKAMMFQQSGQKVHQVNKENDQPANEKVFELEKKQTFGTEDIQAGFHPVKDDVEQVVYGDPQSESKLKFFEKVRKMKENNGEMAKYDTLGPPAPVEVDYQKMFPFMPDY